MVSVSQIIYGNCVKYDRLKSIIDEAFVGSEANNLNIYIDLYSILKQAFKKEINVENYFDIASCVINTCAHYREFFKRYYNVDTSFYLIFSYNIYNKSILPDYNAKFEQLVNSCSDIRFDLIEKNLNLLEHICPYLPNIYFINGKYEVGVYIKDLMHKIGKDNKLANMVITKDSYLYQLVDTDTIILRPKKNKDTDASYFVSINNIYSSLAVVRKSVLSCYELFQDFISPELYSWILAVSNCPERNIKSIVSLPETLKLFKSLITCNMINNCYTSYDLTSTISSVSNKYIPNNLYNRFKAIDINYQLISCKSSNVLFYNLQNLFDPEGIKYINNHYFQLNPLDLNRL